MVRGANHKGVGEMADYMTTVQKMAADPAVRAEMEKHWNVVCDRVEQHAIKRRPKPKVFEVHHMTETARKAYLTAVAAGDSFDLAMVGACNAVGVPA